MILGIVLGEAVYSEHIAFYIVISIVCAISIVVLACIKKIRRFFYIPLALLVGFAGMSISNAVFDAKTDIDDVCEIQCTIAGEITLYDEQDRAKFVVSDIYYDGNRLDYDGFVLLFDDEPPTYNAGDTVVLYGRIMGVEHIKFDSYYASSRADNIGFRIFASSASKTAEKSAKFPLNVQISIKRLLHESNDEYTASICQALVLGDKSNMDGDLYSDIGRSGLAHVLAVSGLHITVLSGALYFVLKKLKINPKICFVVVTLLTLLYSMLCSFTASSLRAVIMCAVFAFADAFGFKRDGLSAISLAAILILLFRPTALMEVGFVLSFFAMLGLILFGRSFKVAGMKVVDKVSPKRHFGKKLVDVCAMSFATNIMTFPFVAFFFGRVPVLFVLSNFFILPYVMVVYVVLLICTLLSLITSFGGFLWIMQYLFAPFRLYVGAIGSLSFAAIPISCNLAFAVCFTIILLFLSKFVFASKRTKAVGALTMSSAAIALCSLFALV